MFKSFGIAAICAYAAFASHAAYSATVTELGTLDGMPFNDSRPFGRDNSTGSIEDFYTFETTKRSNISASVTNSFSSMAQYIDGFTIELFSGFPPMSAGTDFVTLASNQPIASGTNTQANTPPNTQNAKLGILGQLAGNYYLRVTGSTMGSPSYTGSLAIAISTVPLPASAPMFGAAVLALGAAGYAAKRKKAAAA